MGAGRISLTIASLCALALPAHAGGGSSDGRVVYASDGSIFVSSADGSLRWRLTRSEIDHAPAWSPDGTNVAFLRTEDDGVDLYVVPSEGGVETRLAENVDLTFDWAPDSRQIVYSSTGTDLLPGDAHLFVVGVASGVTRQLTDAQRSDVSPQWAPGGGSIAFVGSPASDLPGTARPDSDIYRLDITSGRVSLLTQHEDPDYGPAWSPDGKRIAFLSARHGRGTADAAPEIFVMNAAGRGLRRLTRSPATHDVAPQWSPDGKHIAYLEYPGAAEEDGGRVRVMAPDGSDKRALTDMDETMVWDPSWSPDGKWIVFVGSSLGEEGGRDTEIAFVDAHTGAVDALTRNTRYEWGPDWR